MTTGDGKPFLILGAGLSGPLMAAYLGQAGYRVHLYDMRRDPREAGAQGGRSINLALSRRGIHALEEIGIMDRVREIVISMRGRIMHAPDGELSFQPYGTAPEDVLFSVSRSRLNELVLDAAEACPTVSLHFEHKVVDADIEAGQVVFEDTRTGEALPSEPGVIIGADGAFSRIRNAMQRGERFNYRQDYLEHGYKELTMPPVDGGTHAVDAHALHIWPRASYMMIALPNQDGTFTCTLFWPFKGEYSFESIRTGKAAHAFFQQTFPDAVPLLPDLVQEFDRNPVGSLITVRCRPWRSGGNAVLIGDACHAIVPFYGQGMNAAFEDCTILIACIREHAPDWETAFRVYEERRKADVDTLADLALYNFIEMRDHTGSRLFLLRKWLERTLHRLFPWWYVPLYAMVTFTRTPYAQARAKAVRQDRIVLVSAVLLVVILAAVLLAIAL